MILIIRFKLTNIYLLHHFRGFKILERMERDISLFSSPKQTINSFRVPITDSSIQIPKGFPLFSPESVNFFAVLTFPPNFSCRF